MLNRIRLSVKLTFAFGLVLALLMGVAGIYEYALAASAAEFSTVIDRHVAIANHARQAEVLMLQCRRSEKDFLLRKDLQYATSLQDNAAKLKAETNAIIALAKDPEDSQFAAMASEIAGYTVAYEREFGEIVKAWETRGLDENSGLQGRFRTAAHNIMSRVQDHEVGDLYLAMLQVRRFEKDYLRAPTDDYKAKLATALAVCRRLAQDRAYDSEAKQGITKALEAYAGAFDKYLAANGKADLQAESYESMRAAAHDVEDAISSVYVPDAGKLVLSIRREEKDYLLRGDEKYVTATRDAVGSLAKAFESAGIAAKHVSAVKTIADAYLAAFEGLVGADNAIASSTATLRQTVHKIEPLVAKIAADAMEQTQTRTQATLAHARSLGHLALCVAVGTTLLGVVVCMLFIRSITKPLRSLFGGLRTLSAYELRQTTESFHKIIAGLTESSEQVASASDQISSASQSLAEGATEQAAGLQETSSGLEEMSAMTRQNADNAHQANTLAAEAKKAAGTGAESMNRMNAAIRAIQKSSDETAKIIKVIDEIAFQTNLLALNAAVEAARAGEAGKGFAVVAEEVRNLAMRSAEAAKNTAGMIEEAVKNAKNGVDIATEVGKVLDEIVQSVSKTTDLVGEIAAASQEQAQGIDQVNTAVSQMDKVTQQNAANAEESASASEELSAQAEGMKEIVGQLVAMVGEAALRNRRTNTEDKQLSIGRPKSRTQSFGKSDGVLHQIANRRTDSRHAVSGPIRERIPLDGDDDLGRFNT